MVRMALNAEDGGRCPPYGYGFGGVLMRAGPYRFLASLMKTRIYLTLDSTRAKPMAIYRMAR